MNNYSELVTPVLSKTQFAPIEGKEHLMGKNHSGAYTFTLDCWKRLNRFLILGVEGSTMYQSKKSLVKENYEALKDCLNTDFKRTVDVITEISVEGRAPKNDTAVFALAVACLHSVRSEEVTKENRNYAYSRVKEVCRIGTHLFMFLQYTKELKGKNKGSMGMGLQKAVHSYYNTKSRDRLVLDLLKYRSREGWSHQDVIKLSRWNGNNDQNQIIDYVMKGETNISPLPELIAADVALKACKDDKNLVLELVEQHNVPWEMVPTEYLNDKDILRSLIPNMGATALIRNLSKFTAYGVIENSPTCPYLSQVCTKLENVEYIQKGRVHPLQIAVATLTYLKGTVRTGDQYSPINKVVKSLDVAFLNAFKSADKLDIRIDLWLDVSGSMSWPENMVNGITSAQLGCVMASWLTKQEDFTRVFAFSNNSDEIVGPMSDYRQLCNAILPFQRTATHTNCAAPIINALKNKRMVDLFFVWTDNETNSSFSGHASDILKQYRREVNPDAKMIVVAATPTDCSIADASDPGMLDVSGFDSSIAQIVSSFVKGW